MYWRLNLAEEDQSSELTNSVEAEFQPPRSRMSPPSPLISQHKWPNLFSTSLTGVAVKSPVRGSNLRQDCSNDDSELGDPPQRRWPHKVERVDFWGLFDISLYMEMEHYFNVISSAYLRKVRFELLSFKKSTLKSWQWKVRQCSARLGQECALCKRRSCQHLA